MTIKAKPKIAVVGAGYWGPNWVRTILGSDVAEISTVCDSDPQRREFIKETFPNVPLTDSFDSLVSDENTDAIIIVTPPESHENLGVQALRSGKHVLVEKPLSVSVEAAKNLHSEAISNDRTLAVGHVFAYNPAVVAMKSSLLSGDLGSLKYANSSRMNMPPPNAEHSVIWDLAVHDISISLTLNDAIPVRVSATGNNYRHSSLIDAATITLEFDDGSVAWHHVGWLSAERVRTYFVGCERGSMKFDDTLSTEKLKLYGEGIDTRLAGGSNSSANLAYSTGDITVSVLDETSPLEAELVQFVQAMQGGSPPTADSMQGLIAVEILAAAEESITSGGISIALSNQGI
jgi:predicted dehydrogenase